MMEDVQAAIERSVVYCMVVCGGRGVWRFSWTLPSWANNSLTVQPLWAQGHMEGPLELRVCVQNVCVCVFKHSTTASFPPQVPRLLNFKNTLSYRYSCIYGVIDLSLFLHFSPGFVLFSFIYSPLSVSSFSPFSHSLSYCDDLPLLVMIWHL